MYNLSDDRPYKPLSELRRQSIERTLDEICSDYSCTLDDIRLVLDGKPLRRSDDDYEVEPPKPRCNPNSVTQRVAAILRVEPDLRYSDISRKLGPDASEYSIRTAMSKFKRACL